MHGVKNGTMGLISLKKLWSYLIGVKRKLKNTEYVSRAGAT